MINAFVHNKWVSVNEPMVGFLAGESVPVNKKLSGVLLQLHISEKTGDKSNDKVSDKNTESCLNRTQVHILAEIRNNQNITKQRLAEILKIGKTMMDKAIAILKKYGYMDISKESVLINLVIGKY